jgi:anti-repressor protein
LSKSCGDPWFVLSDVCRVLDIGNPPDVARRLDDDEKRTLAWGDRGSADTLDSIEGHSGRGGPRSWVFASAPGLYGLIMTSRKDAARRFQRWVKHEVLPSIQRTGGYMMNIPGETEKQFWARARPRLHHAR